MFFQVFFLFHLTTFLQPRQEKGLSRRWRPEAHPGQGVILS